ncbi:MAG: YfcC family protein [Aminipila sp.]
MENTLEKKKRGFKVPHTYVIIGIILIVVTCLTYIIPAGSYDRIEDPITGRTIVDGDSFQFIEQTPVNPFRMVMAIADGMVEASDIIFFIFFAYGFVFLLIKTGAFYGSIGALTRKLHGAEAMIFPVFMVMFGICGSTFGMYEETYGLLPAFIGISIALGYDGLVGGAAVVLGVATGFAAATLNPFTIGIAQGIAEIPIGSGFAFRAVCFVLFEGLVIWYLMRYANKVKNDPSKSLVKDVDFNFGEEGMTRSKMENLPFTGKHKFIMLLFVLTIAILVYGTTQLGWYLSELSALFLIMTFVVGIVGGYNLSEICKFCITAVSEVIFGALVVGVARSLTIVMTEGNIIDTIVYYMASMLSNVSSGVAALGMLGVQNLLNFFIPSGSGQAAVSMPVMVPLADAIGIHRQIAVLAFQFGDGFSNLFWPTAVATECGLMGIPVEKWYKFMTPLFFMMLGLQVILIIIATSIGFS